MATEIQAKVISAVNEGDISRLRELSLLPGGFGDARTVAWPYLLQARSSSSTLTPAPEAIASSSTTTVASTITSPIASSSSPPLSYDDEPHQDESQIKLDTDRSFVLYPSLHDTKKDLLKSRLNRLITRVLRKRRKLAYVQGYHDVLAVLQLTLCPGQEPSEEDEMMLERCAERISLFRFRDAMGRGLEPLLGLLRVLRRLLRLADPAYAALIEQTTPLPYYALSNLLTLFAHDVPTLPLIQHIWDFLLSREPVWVVYLCAALILERKEELLQRVREDGDEGVLYVLLSGLPPLVDSDSLPCSSESDDDNPPLTPSSSASLPPYTPGSSSSLTPRSPPLLLPHLLHRTEALYVTFPPSHPGLKLEDTLGPASVHRAPWPPELTEDEAEVVVTRPSDIVLSLDEDEEPALEELKGAPSSKGRRTREQEMRTLMAVLVVGAGVMIAIYTAEGGMRAVDWLGLARVAVGVVREGAGRLARGA
ncbi:hypothetical protein DACRYDRAFT_107280 [Dacryopinax primogenitus]|uniref:Rab-GAP TBC domain-containing protein n=1 Tax=Dacryopinax primogenitus (strain DJM 731) TaxID=1858805 RepID=M5G0T4_DACPD|nr:uncharacterized protein DACRYDRAFT_107280 [Dacryopinax primogenitus]EJU02354.1 hypothetical protein DACRYDRAFT_107280 [Dacryopinax primogenitus]